MSVSPRDVRLTRVRHLRAAQQVVAALCSHSAPTTLVVTPTVHAARELERTLETLRNPTWDETLRTVLGVGTSEPGVSDVSGPGPLVVTRAGLYDALHERLRADRAQVIGVAGRHAILRRASDAARDAGLSPPFDVRPGLVDEMLALYDRLRLNRRIVDDFERVTTDVLEPSAAIDRGAARLLAQTRFLAFVFREYERQLGASGALDEHALRELLAREAAESPIARIVLTVGDQVADRHGLWPGDFDLLIRLPGLERLDVVATARALDAGLRTRLFELLPGIEEHRWDGENVDPVLVAPIDAGRRYFLSRDREEELHDIVQATAAERGGELESVRVAPGNRHRLPLDQIVIAYDRPLPYVYLASRLLENAGVPFTIADALPLAAEPFAAALDLVMATVSSDFTRSSLVQLIESPLLAWRVDRRPFAPADILAFEDWLRASGFEGGGDDLLRAADTWSPPTDMPASRVVRLKRAIAAAVAVVRELAPLEHDAPMSVHLQGLRELLERHEVRRFPSSHGAGHVRLKSDAAYEGRPDTENAGPRPDATYDEKSDAMCERHARARRATIDLLAELAAAHRAYGDPVVPFSETGAVVRRAIERHTFVPTSGSSGVRLMDARAARYARASSLWILGLVEGEWPSASRGSIFYPSSMLLDLGFASEQERLPAARAAFLDLLLLPSADVRVSSFQLEEDAIVRPSIFLDDLEEVPLRVVSSEAVAPHPDATPRLDPVGTQSRRGVSDTGGAATDWASWRARRGELADPRFRGQTGSPPPRVPSVTEIERYLDCPFKYFAIHELHLEEEEVTSLAGLDPRQRGTLIHEIFQRFFERWSADEGGAITPDRMADARAMFAGVVDERLATIPEADRVLERTLLVGSAAAPGLGERVLRLEALRPIPVVERLLELNVRGSYRFASSSDTRADGRVELRGKADRVDLLADGTLRVIDYKTGRAPDPRRAIQLAIYALCAEQRLDGYRGRSWRVGEAAYLALADKRPWIRIIEDPGQRAPLDAARDRFLDALAGIARGDFAPRPAESRMCTSCAFATVCRREGLGGPGRA